jgi:hypothetical protein
MWLNALICCLVPRNLLHPVRCGLYPRGIPLGLVAPVFPGQEWWGRPWHWVPDFSCLVVGGVGRVQGIRQ